MDGQHLCLRGREISNDSPIWYANKPPQSVIEYVICISHFQHISSSLIILHYQKNKRVHCIDRSERVELATKSTGTLNRISGIISVLDELSNADGLNVYSNVFHTSKWPQRILLIFLVNSYVTNIELTSICGMSSERETERKRRKHCKGSMIFRKKLS